MRYATEQAIEPAIEQTIEPEILSTLPRRIVYRNARIRTSNIVFGFIVVLLIGLGLGMFMHFCLQLMLITNPPITGRITEIKMPPAATADGASPEENIKSAAARGLSARLPVMEYTFTVNGHEINDSIPLSQQQLSMLPQTDTILVRTLPFFYELEYRPILPNDTFMGWVVILGFITLLSEVAIGTLCWFAFALPRLQREIYRVGLPAVGTVTRMECRDDGGNVSTLFYRFEIKDDPYNPPKVLHKEDNGVEPDKSINKEGLGEMRVTREQAETVNVDDHVTVLYLPKRPEMNLIYKFGMYRAQPRLHV